MAPAEFLPRAEESQLIAEIGEWALDAACEQAARWWRAGRRVAVAVNLSPRGLIEVDLAERVATALRRHSVPGEALWLEVTEDWIGRDPERARTALAGARNLGVRVALDGFGSGDCRLKLLAGVPLDVVKIDRSLIGTIEQEQTKRAMAAAIVTLARRASLPTIAVGIETPSQLSVARRLGCTHGQGFLLHAPCRAERLSLERSGAIRSRPSWRPLARRRPRP
jgi:EAL domain-containing protein (putative c-di-GMP-specific phosphodiesterase class I)